MECLTEDKLCTECFQVQPVTEFRREKKGSEKRRNQCNECHRLGMQKLRADKRKKILFKGFRHMTRPSTPLKDLENCLAAMFPAFGGMMGFCAAWHDAHQEARACNDYKFITQSCHAFLRLTIECDQASRAETRQEINSMSDQELAQEYFDHVATLVRANPQLAVEAAGELGWQVIPPEDDDGFGERFRENPYTA